MLGKYFTRMAIWQATAIFFVTLDRLLKIAALSGLKIDLIGAIFQFNFAKNYYIAFSLPFAGRLVVAAILLIILLLIYSLIVSWRQGKLLAVISFAAIILGAASNLFDRIKYGFVIDYFDVKYFTVFNLADVMIVGGVLIFLIGAYKKEAV